MIRDTPPCQTEGVLANRDVLVERARVKRAEASRELGNELTYPIGGETGDPDTYDDPEFYQQVRAWGCSYLSCASPVRLTVHLLQLLREFIKMLP